MRGGVNSTGMLHAAAMMLRRPAWAVVTSTVGPWLMRRLAWWSSTGAKWLGAGMERVLSKGASRQCAGCFQSPARGYRAHLLRAARFAGTILLHCG